MEEKKELNPKDDESCGDAFLGKTLELRKKLVISSKRKWFWVGILIAFLNPILAGFLIAAFYLSEPDLKKEGMIVAGVAIFWGVLSLYFLRQNFLSINF